MRALPPCSPHLSHCVPQWAPFLSRKRARTKNERSFMLQKLKSLFAGEQKRFSAAPLISLHTVGRPQWTPRNYAALAKEGFAGNAIGYRCVRMLAEAASSVPLLVYDGGKELAAHP